MHSVSSYSEMLHPNADPSEISQFNGAGPGEVAEPPKLGRFKRMVAWIDENWLKKLLVCKNADQMKAADDIEELIERVMQEDPTDANGDRNNMDFMSITPVIRETLEKRRAEEIRQGRVASMILLANNRLNS